MYALQVILMAILGAVIGYRLPEFFRGRKDLTYHLLTVIFIITAVINVVYL
jgi:hypothetical protein